MSTDETPTDDASSENWNKTRQRVLERDGYECRFCGKTEEEHVEDTGRGIDVHHIIPRSDGGGDVMNNLAALCRSCHRTMENLHGRAMGDVVRKEDYREDLEGLSHVFSKYMQEWDEFEELLAEWLENHRVFRDEMGFYDESREGTPSIFNAEMPVSRKLSEKGISSEWEFLVAYGYKEGVSDVAASLDGHTSLPLKEFQ